MGSLGETLRQARIDRGATLADAERTTFIRRRYLEALEAEDYSSLPAQVYTRGFIRTYADYLGLNPQAMVELYQPPRARDATPRLRPATTPLSRARQIPIRTVLTVGGALLVIAVLVYLGQVYYSFNESLRRAEVTQLPSRINQPTPTVPSLGAAARASLQAETPTSLPSPSATPRPIEGVEVVMTVDQDIWVEAWVDGEPRFAETISPGEEKTLSGARSVKLLVANAGAVHVVVNGEAQDPLGGNGQVVEAVWTR